MLEPDIEDFVEIHVREQRRDHAALRCAAVGIPHGTVLLHTRIQPLVDRSSNHSVTYPLFEDGP